MKKWLCALLFVSSPAFSNTFIPDLSDLWWNASESGWGVTVTHQREIVFLTFFIYGPDGRPSWYTGQSAYLNKNGQGAYVFTGTMSQVNGTWFGTPFDTSAVTARSVGSLTFTALQNSATLTYSIDGVSVNKSLTRQTFRNNDVSGFYMGAIKITQSGCRSPFVAGDYNNYIDLVISNSATTFAMTSTRSDGTICNYSGNYTQYGRFGMSNGTYNCAGGLTGTYAALDIEANNSGFVGRYTAGDNFCSTISGRFAAMRK